MLLVFLCCYSSLVTIYVVALAILNYLLLHFAYFYTSLFSNKLYYFNLCYFVLGLVSINKMSFARNFMISVIVWVHAKESEVHGHCTVQFFCTYIIPLLPVGIKMFQRVLCFS